MLEALPRLAPAVLRHLIAYVELLSEETGGALRQFRRRALGAVITVAAGALAAVLGCLWVIAATWDGPNRLTAVGSLCIGFVLLTVLAAFYTRGAIAKPVFKRLRTEWRADLEQIDRLYPTLRAHAPPANGPRGPEHV